MTSVDNEAGRASGHADIPLAARGREEAERIGRHYEEHALHAVFCSDLKRAVTTAQLAFGERGVPIFRDARLRECDYGTMTQFPREQVKFAEHITEPFPGGESIVMVAQRVHEFVQELLDQHEGETVVVIAHSATKHALEFWSGTASLEDIINTPWEWLEVPIWRYTFARPLRKAKFMQS